MRDGDGRLGGVLAATALALFVTNLDFFALNLALPDMARDLGVAVTDIQWVISGYMLALGACFIAGGRLGDVLGRRRMLVAGLVVFGGTSLICGLAPSAGVIIAFRVVQGAGAAILFAVAIAVVTNAFPEERRRRAIGNLYGLGAVATAVGPFLGGMLTEALSWRWVLLVNVPVTAVAIVLTLRHVRESRDDSVPSAVDVPGLATVALGVAAVSLAVERGQEWGWGSAATIGVFAGGLGLLAAFLAIERRVRHPLVDLALFHNRPYVVVTMLGMTANTAFVASTYASTLYLQDVRGYSAIEAGLVFLAASLAVAATGPLSGRLAERFDIPRMMGGGIVVGAAGLAVIAAEAGLPVYVPALAVFGLGYGLCWALSSIGTQSVVAAAKAGQASGVTLAFVVGVAGLGVAVVAALVEELTAHGGEADAIQTVLFAVAAVSGVAALALLAAARRMPLR